MQGVIQIVRYNWLTYVSAVVVSAAALVLASQMAPSWLSIVIALAALGTLLGTAVSLVASYWIYDASPLRRWDWLAEFVGTPPRHWANVHTGLDEVTPDLLRLFPTDRPRVIDLFDALPNPSASIARARRMTPPVVVPEPGRPEALPLTTGSLDSVFLIFAAHEVRRRDLRVRLFREVHRALRPGGQVVLVEHLRDVPNALVFGPGAWHFLSAAEWRHCIREAALDVAAERSLTPFVRAVLLRKD